MLYVYMWLILLILDGDELEVSIAESNQLFSTSSSNLLTLGNSGNNTNNTQSNSLNGSTSPGSNSPNISINGSDQHPGINIANGPSDNDTKSIVPNKSSPNTPRIKNSSISTYQLRSDPLQNNKLRIFVSKNSSYSCIFINDHNFRCSRGYRHISHHQCGTDRRNVAQHVEDDYKAHGTNGSKD